MTIERVVWDYADDYKNDCHGGRRCGQDVFPATMTMPKEMSSIHTLLSFGSIS